MMQILIVVHVCCTKEKSKTIFQKGLHKREEFQKVEDEFGPHVEICDGKFGDYLIFQNSICLHRINKPKRLKETLLTSIFTHHYISLISII